MALCAVQTGRGCRQCVGQALDQQPLPKRLGASEFKFRILGFRVGTLMGA